MIVHWELTKALEELGEDQLVGYDDVYSEEALSRLIAYFAGKYYAANERLE